MAPSFSITRWQKGIALIFGLSFIGLLIYNQQVPTAKIKIGGQNLTVLLAQTPARQYTGLGGRADLGKYDGMLFTFPVADKYAFVMRDMHFSIDIIWLNNGKIVDIAPSVPLEIGVAESNLRRYRPRLSGNAVLELPAGFSAKHQIKIGDIVR